jgi:hypothetical protein
MGYGPAKRQVEISDKMEDCYPMPRCKGDSICMQVLICHVVVTLSASQDS